MEELCHQLRYLPTLKKWARKGNLRLLCEGRDKDGSTSTVIVSVVSSNSVLSSDLSGIKQLGAILSPPQMLGLFLSTQLLKFCRVSSTQVSRPIVFNLCKYELATT